MPPVKVHYSSLPNFEEREEEFRAESVLLRRRFTHEGAAHGFTCLPQRGPDSHRALIAVAGPAPLGTSHAVLSVLALETLAGSAEEDSLVRVSNDKLPGHALALSLQKVWEVIQHQKDLNLPAHKVRCGLHMPLRLQRSVMHIVRIFAQTCAQSLRGRDRADLQVSLLFVRFACTADCMLAGPLSGCCVAGDGGQHQVHRDHGGAAARPGRGPGLGQPEPGGQNWPGACLWRSRSRAAGLLPHRQARPISSGHYTNADANACSTLLYSCNPPPRAAAASSRP